MPEVAKALLLFEDVGQLLDWEHQLRQDGIEVQSFCRAFDASQALTLLEYFQKKHEIQFVLADKALLADVANVDAQKLAAELQKETVFTKTFKVAETTHKAKVTAKIKAALDAKPQSYRRRRGTGIGGLSEAWLSEKLD